MAWQTAGGSGPFFMSVRAQNCSVLICVESVLSSLGQASLSSRQIRIFLAGQAVKEKQCQSLIGKGSPFLSISVIEYWSDLELR